ISKNNFIDKLTKIPLNSLTKSKRGNGRLYYLYSDLIKAKLPSKEFFENFCNYINDINMKTVFILNFDTLINNCDLIQSDNVILFTTDDFTNAMKSKAVVEISRFNQNNPKIQVVTVPKKYKSKNFNKFNKSISKSQMDKFIK
ncbi:MAG: hypothetical protein LBN03_02020, partial [Bifidobacteriaceae bacterium]|nr:hypothetical protein [Bifidobacteriaceae bacterium]